MQRVLQSDSKALEVLYNRYSPLLYTLIKRIISDEETAEEVLAEAFVIVWKKVEQFDFDSDNVYTWLVTLTRNKAVDTLRRRRNPESAVEYSDELEDNFILPHISPKTEPIELGTVLKIKPGLEKALATLTDAQAYVLSLGFYDGLTEEEIAAKLKIPLPTVKSKIKVTLSHLRDNLIKEEA
jgi:RNA polymerase sigma-70 factor, ECF subfamily